MTGRRAVRQWDERLSRALQFVPGHVGGRVASAQPIRRRGGTLRQASVGGTGLLPATMSYAGGGSASLVTASATTVEIPSAAAAAGRYAIILASVPDETVSAPAGWTVADSGVVGDLSWLVAWRIIDGATDDYTLTATGTGYDASTYSGNIIVNALYYNVTGSAVPVVTKATSTAASRTPVYPATILDERASFVVALDAVGFVEDPESGEAEITRPSTSWAFSGVTGGAALRTHYQFRLRPIPTTKPSPDVFTSTESGTDWLAVGIGWAAA